MSESASNSTEPPKNPPSPKMAQGVAVAIAITLLAGIAHGYLDGRWSAQLDLRAQGAMVKELPDKCGSWVLVNEGDLDQGAADVLRCYGSTVCEYLNEETGDRINVAVLFGPRGPTAIHIPEICFNSIGTNQVGDRQVETINIAGTEHTLWSVQFARGDDPRPSIDAWYAWSDGGAWQASNYPRFWMTDTLYKVQVSGPVSEGASVSPCRSFLTAFLPHLEELKQRN